MLKRRLQKLESIRGFAAVYVVLHHLARTFLPHRWYRFPFLFGPEAVMVFFVLSGFVIYYSTRLDPRDLQFRNYSVKRVRRIYPIFICALFIAYFCQAIITRSWFVPDWKMLAGNLAMLQGTSIDPFYDGPLWSLSYEWWFYVLFFAVAKIEKVPARRQLWAAGLSLIGLVSNLFFLNQASLFLMYFMIWWCGVELAREYIDTGRITWRCQRLPVGMLGALSVLSLLLVIKGLPGDEPFSFIDYPFLFFRHLFFATLLIGLGIGWYKLRFFGFSASIGRFALFAPISYGIYVVHAPILLAVASIAPGHLTDLKIGLIVALILGIAYVLEGHLQPRINRWSNCLLERRPLCKAALNNDLQPIAAT